MGNLDTHKRLARAFRARDWEAAAAWLSPDVAIVDHPAGATIKGVADVVEHSRRATVAFSDVTVEEERFYDAGDHTVAVFVSEGVNDGELVPGVPPTHRPMRMTVCEILRYDERGRVVGGEYFYDALSQLVQLGLVEPPSAPSAF
ncbi:ester cyclase [Streptomyces sp. B1866]|uniref:ester cyclase n=1 Tax=Streptomyces sp. B1866 TaxID=3075431 RepID=UPI00288E26FB|nr:ester cyclase [Streptomyces sp. B1866]MDT3396959.1 ester cyclase [Streptomyces sp. B1866]